MTDHINKGPGYTHYDGDDCTTEEQQMSNLEQAIAALQNLSSNLDTTSLIMTRCKVDEIHGTNHAQELLGAKEMVDDWVKGLKEEQL